MVSVSTIIPTYNRPDTLMTRAIPSVLAQTVTDWECIVVGDGTDAETVAAMEALCERDGRFRFWNRPRATYPTDAEAAWRIGGLEAFNFGLDQATGDFVSYLGDDDAYRPQHHETLLFIVGEFDVAYGCSSLFFPGGIESGRRYGMSGAPNPFDIVQGTYLLRRSVGLRIRPGDIRLNTSWDAEMWYRLIEQERTFINILKTVHDYHPAPENFGFHNLRVGS